MKIRQANKFDLPVVLEMLRNFRNNTPIEMMRECNNEEYISKLFHHIISGKQLFFFLKRTTKKLI